MPSWTTVGQMLFMAMSMFSAMTRLNINVVAQRRWTTHLFAQSSDLWIVGPTPNKHSVTGSPASLSP